MRPISDALHQAVFNGIDMHVIHVRREIGFVPYQMFPISALPDTALAPALAHDRATFGNGKRLGKPGLDQAPAHRKIIIALG